MNTPLQIEQIPYYLTWKLRHEVMYPELTIEDIKLPEDPEGLHFGLFTENTLTSVLSLFENNQEVQLRKFATVCAQQGKGFGQQLLVYAIHFVKDTGAKRLWCNARVNAMGFYAKQGFKATGNTFFSNGHEFTRMELPLN